MIWLQVEWLMGKCVVSLHEGNRKESVVLSDVECINFANALSGPQLFSIDEGCKGRMIFVNGKSREILILDLAYTIPRELRIPLVQAIFEGRNFNTKPKESKKMEKREWLERIYLTRRGLMFIANDEPEEYRKAIECFEKGDYDGAKRHAVQLSGVWVAMGMLIGNAADKVNKPPKVEQLR